MDLLEVLNPQHQPHEIWETSVLENFKPSLMAMFDERNNPYKHVASINTQMTIIVDSLKCELLSNSFRDTTRRGHMGLPRLPVTSYHDLVKKLVHSFATSRLRKLTATNLFGIF